MIWPIGSWGWNLHWLISVCSRCGQVFQQPQTWRGLCLDCGIAAAQAAQKEGE